MSMLSMGISSRHMSPEDLHSTDAEHPVHEDSGNGNGNGIDPDLARLIEIAESRQVPELLWAADATHTIAGTDGPRWRFEGEGTSEGDEILLSSFRSAFERLDVKRDGEKSESVSDV
jgi:hypothetical protein